MTMRRDVQVLRGLCRLGVAAMIAACSDGSGPGFGTCPQTGEFGNFGCARVVGVARSQDGTPLAGVHVSLSPVEDTGQFDVPVDETDATGAYSLEMHDYSFSETGEPTPDTVAANIHGYLLKDPLSTPSFGGPVPVKLKFVPVGELPEEVEADITINVTP